MDRIFKILLVEDDDKLRNTVTDYLQMNNFSVTACADGSSALFSFENESPFDIILLDGMLPDIDGFDVLKKSEKLRISLLSYFLLESQNETS